jgi:flagellin
LADILTDDTNQTVSFSNLGISITLTSSSTNALADTMGGDLDGDEMVVAAGAVNTLSFQIGASPTASGDSIAIATNNINTINSDLDSMKNVGWFITNDSSDTGLAYLSANTSSDATDAKWNAAFKSLNGYVSTAINDISSARATLGAQMNQLGFVDTTVQAQSANEQAARSTVVDTNYSAETASLTKGQIMQQAATAMLAQANQMPNVILSLLK